MAIRGKTPASAPAKASRGRRPTTSEPVTAWDVALDLLRPGVVPRMLRFRLATDRIGAQAGAVITQADLADELGCEPRTLNAYLTQDPKRPLSLAIDLRRSLAARLCEDRDAEPWLSDGRWFDDRAQCIAPAWLQEATLPDQLASIGHLLALAHLRMLGQGVGGDAGVAAHLTADRWVILHQRSGGQSTGGMLALETLLRWIPEVTDLGLGFRQRLVAVYQQILSDRLSHRDLWLLAPKEVERAAKIVLAESVGRFDPRIYLKPSL